MPSPPSVGVAARSLAMTVPEASRATANVLVPPMSMPATTRRPLPSRIAGPHEEASNSLAAHPRRSERADHGRPGQGIGSGPAHLDRDQIGPRHGEPVKNVQLPSVAAGVAHHDDERP